MPRFPCEPFLLLGLAALLPSAFAGDLPGTDVSSESTVRLASDARISITAGFSGYCRPGHFLPITLRIETRERPLRGPLIVSSDSIVLSRYIELPAPSVREIPILLAPHSANRAIEAKFIAHGTVAAQARLEALHPVPPTARMAALLDGPAVRFASLLECLPEGSLMCRVAPEGMPRDYRGYDALDLLIAADLTTRLDAPQREALTLWLRRGGRLLIIMPADGFGSVSSFWRTFLPAELAALRERSLGLEEIRRAGLAALHDEDLPGLLGFEFGLGKVLLSAYGQQRGPIGAMPFTGLGNKEVRHRIARAIVRLLDLEQPRCGSPAPLLARDAYDIFDEPSWPEKTRRGIWLAALGYVAVMAVALRVLVRERPGVCAGLLLAFSALFTGVMCFAVVPQSALVCQAASVATTSAVTNGAAPKAPHSAAVDRYIRFSSITGEGVEVGFREPVKPLFYSETMLRHGPVHLDDSGGLWRYEIAPGAEGGAATCFQQAGVLALAGSITVEPGAAGNPSGALLITNEMKNAATGEPIVLEDAILTDGAGAVYVGALPCGKVCTVDFSPGRRRSLDRLVWDRFGPDSDLAGASGCHRKRMLDRWAKQHLAGSGLWLLGWSEAITTSAGGRAEVSETGFLARIEHPTLWQIEVTLNGERPNE